MAASPQQIAQAIKVIEDQLAFLKESLGKTPIMTDGIIGVFDGEYMVEENGRRHQVPPNYASKTMLVPGDTVKKIEDPSGGRDKFKQIGKVEREKSVGMLAKKDGKFEVLSEAGSFKVLSAAIKHYNGEVGDTVAIQFPKNHTKGSWAAVEKVYSQAESASKAKNTEASQSNGKTASPPVEPVLSPIVAGGSGVALQPEPLSHQSMAPQQPVEQVAAEDPVSAPASTAKPSSSAKSDGKSKKPSSAKKSTPKAAKPSTQSKSESSKSSATKSSSRVSATVEQQSTDVAPASFDDDDLI